MSIIRKAILAFALMAGLVPAFAQAPPPVPALPDTERRTTYSISSSTCACAVNFALYGDSTDYANWLEVWINGTLIPQSGNWTITSPTGPLATIPRPITDAVLTFTQAQTGTVQIVGARRPRRTSQFAENRGVAARDLNQALTDIVAMLREDWDKINDVSGRAVLAPPGETLNVLVTASSRANSGACFDSNGQLVSCVSIPSTTFTAGNGISITGTSPKTITNNIQGSGPIVITGTNPLLIGCPTCNTSPAAATSAVFVASRTAAAAIDLHTYTVITTGGYAAGGDGGGATFKNIGSAAFLDTRPTFTLTTAGTGCTNGTNYVAFVGGNGFGTFSNFTVAGGSVTSGGALSTPGVGYAIGDTITVYGGVAGCSVQPVWTVTAITTPTGSFTDSVGTHWQILINPDGHINARAFGFKADWTNSGGDAGATDNAVSLQNALWFAYGQGVDPQLTASGKGAVIDLPPKVGMACATINIPFGVTLQGAGRYASGLKSCDALTAANNFIEAGDQTAHVSCFGVRIADLSLYSISGSANAGTAMVASNCIQQMNFMERVLIYGTNRGCISLTVGYGGAAFVGMRDIQCGFSSTSQTGININYGGAIVDLNNIIIEIGGSNFATNAMTLTSGVVSVQNFHMEGYATGIFINGISTQGPSQFHNITGANCTDLVKRQTGSGTNFNVIGIANGCTNTLNNAGTTTSGAFVANSTF